MNWNAHQVEVALAELKSLGDDTTLIECKLARQLPENLPETTCAFANLPDGGTIFLGVDSSLEIRGVKDAAALQNQVAAQTRNSVVPAPHLDFWTVEIRGKRVLIVQVQPLSPSQKPARYKGNAMLRQGDGDHVMNANDLHMMEVAALHDTERDDYDLKTLPGSSVSDLDESALKQYLAKCRNQSRRLGQINDDSKILELTGVTSSSGELTYAGLYSLGFYPQAKLPALSITAAVQLPSDGTGRRIKNLKHFDGPAPALLEDSMEWVRENISSDRTYNESGHLVQESEIPMTAIREVIANALIHRDLGPDTVGAGKRVEIRITQDALVIESPGGLKGVSVSQLESSNLSKAAVNQRLYEHAKRTVTSDGHAVVEGEGGGILEVFQATRYANLRQPKLINSGVSFKVIFRRKKTAEHTFSSPPEPTPSQVSANADATKTSDLRLPHGKNVSIVFASVAEENKTIQEIMDATQLSEGQVRYALKPLLASGWIDMIGGQGNASTIYSFTTLPNND